MEKTPKISVIVPVYNTAKYLEKCLNSLIYQTYSNLEFICINDGSTDNSLEILNTYAQKDNRIKVISQENKGQSVARNAGIKIATGDYISFIDSDDWVYLTLYQTFVDAITKAKKEIDIWMFNISAYQYGQNDVLPVMFFDASDWNNHTSDDVIHTFDDCMRPFSRNLSAANKIYKKSFLEKIDLLFPEGLKYEDQYFSIKAFMNADTIMFTQDNFYRYRNYHDTSISCVISEKVYDIFRVVDLIEDEIYRLNIYDSYKYAFFQYKYNMFTQHYKLCPEDLRDDYYQEMKNRLLRASKCGLNPQITTKLRNYTIFEVIKNSDRRGFDKALNI